MSAGDTYSPGGGGFPGLMPGGVSEGREAPLVPPSAEGGGAPSKCPRPCKQSALISQLPVRVHQHTWGGMPAEQVLEADPRRYYVLFVAVAGAKVIIWPGPWATPTTGIDLSATGSIWDTYWERAPGLAAVEWWGQGQAGTVTGVIEVLNLGA